MTPQILFKLPAKQTATALLSTTLKKSKIIRPTAVGETKRGFFSQMAFKKLVPIVSSKTPRLFPYLIGVDQKRYIGHASK